MNTLIAANVSCLEQGINLLGRFSASTYAQNCPEVFNSTIGGHIRHNLDHYLAFVQGVDGGEIDYDHRDRDSSVEQDATMAIEVLEKLVIDMKSLATMDLDRPLRIRMDDGGDSSWSQTSLRRELQFLLSHSIHHYALVVSIATRYGFSDFPDGFGIAPSTIHYHEQKEA